MKQISTSAKTAYLQMAVADSNHNIFFVSVDALRGNNDMLFLVMMQTFIFRALSKKRRINNDTRECFII